MPRGVRPDTERKKRLAIDLRANTSLSVGEIAQKLGKHHRTVQRWLGQEAGRRATEQERNPEPKKAAEITDPEVLACLEDSPAGFQAFFNRYSPWSLPPHGRSFVDACFSNDRWRPRVVVNVPPNHAKSTIFSVWFPIWRICLDRDVRVIVLSETADLAKQFTSDICQVLEGNAQLIRDFGRFRGENPPAYTWLPAQGALKVEGSTITRGWNVLARGSMQQVQGMRADVVVADDVVDTDNVLTIDRRAKLSHWFRTIVLTRLDPTGRVFVIGTRHHAHDLYSELSGLRRRDGTPIYVHVAIPALRDPATGAPSMLPDALPLWPHDPSRGECDRDDCRDRAFLEDQYEELGHHVFAQSFQQEPLPPESVTVRPEWVVGSGDFTPSAPGVRHAEEPGIAHPWLEVACVDLDRGLGQARWSRTEADFPVVRVLSIDPSPTQYSGWVLGDVRVGERFNFALLDCDRRKRFGHRDTIGLIERIAEGYGPLDYVIFEVNAAERHFFEQPDVEEIRKRHEIRFLEHTTGRNKSDPGFGLSSMAGDFEFGRIRLPYEGMDARMASKRLIDEVTQHPFGLTDDIFMALWFVKNKLREVRPRERGSSSHRSDGGFHLPSRLKGQKWVR